MALHRDIYWVGRQWAVTGHGMQAVDQKQKSKFDIEVSRLWEDDLFEILRDQAWFNAEDFSKGLSIARARYPEPPGRVRPERKAVPDPVSPPKAPPTIDHIAPLKKDSIPVEPPKPAIQKYHVRMEHCPAKFLRPWRIRIRR